MKTDSANTASVTFHNDYTGIYTDADGNEFPMSWVFDEIFASEITPYPMTVYEVRRAAENLLVFYSDRDHLPHFILYKS